MSSHDTQRPGLQALDAQIQLAESRLIGRELLLRSQGRLLLTRVNDSVVRRLGQGAVVMAGALLLRRFLRPRAAAARATEVPPALGIGPWLMQTLWPLLPKLLRTYVSPALVLNLLGQLSSLWSIRHRSSSKPPQDPP